MPKPSVLQWSFSFFEFTYSFVLFSVLILLPSPLPHWKKKTTANKSSYVSNRLVYERRFHAAGVRNEHSEFTQTSFVPLLPRRGFGLLIPGNFKTAEVYKGGF